MKTPLTTKPGETFAFGVAVLGLIVLLTLRAVFP